MDSGTIRTVGDFLKVIKNLYPENEVAFFRGQSSNSRDVNSSFCRLVDKHKADYDKHKADNDKNNIFPYLLAKRLFDEFKRNMPIYSDNNLLKDYTLNDLDLMMVAQHYGLATRLVDWTKNPLVALYFATEKADPKSDCSIFMMYNVDKCHEVTCVSSQGFFSHVKNEQNTMLEIYRLIESGSMQGLNFDTTTLERIHTILNKDTTSEFIYPPIKVNEEFLSIHVNQLIAIAMNTKENTKYNSILNVFQKDFLNYLASLSSIKIFNNAKYVIEPLPINNRIKNQQGVFVFSNELTSNIISVEELKASNIVTCADAEPALESKNLGVFRIDISKDYIPEIHRELNIYGMSKEFIYPELPSYTEVIQRRVVSEVIRGKILN